VDYTQQVVAGPIQSLQTISDNRHGYTVGGGVEYAFTENVSAKIEYDYLDFGSKTYSFNNLSFSPAAGVAIPIGPFPVSIKSQTHMLMLGANYRFTWGGGYAAKY
jgi:outer membrane immunogenic protein